GPSTSDSRDSKIEVILNQVLMKLESTESGVNKMRGEVSSMVDCTRGRRDASYGLCVEGRDAPLEQCMEVHDATPLFRLGSHNREKVVIENSGSPVSGKEGRKDEGSQTKEKE
ncbi:hypothetical protein HAX54_012947, partial [Datura stramonium]|nr:hypothetical protein [Datura stramonium]